MAASLKGGCVSSSPQLPPSIFTASHCPISAFLSPGWHLALQPLSWVHARSRITFYLPVAMALISMKTSSPFSSFSPVPLHLTEPVSRLHLAGIFRLPPALPLPIALLQPGPCWNFFSWRHPQNLLSAQTIRAFYIQRQVPALCLQVCLQVPSLGQASLCPLARKGLPALLPHNSYGSATLHCVNESLTSLSVLLTAICPSPSSMPSEYWQWGVGHKGERESLRARLNKPLTWPYLLQK